MHSSRRHRSLVSSILLPALGLALAGCTTTAAPSEAPQTGVAKYKRDMRLGESVSNICFAGQIGDFRLFGQDTVIVKSGLGDEFILDVAPGCAPLDIANSVALESGKSCLTAQDNIIVAESSGVSEKCTVLAIHRWNEEVDPVDLQGIRPEDVQPVMSPLK